MFEGAADVGNGDVLLGELPPVGATDAGRDHPAVEGIGLAVSLAVTRREWDSVCVTAGRAGDELALVPPPQVASRKYRPTVAFDLAADDAGEVVVEAACAVFSRNFLLTLTALNFFG